MRRSLFPARSGGAGARHTRRSLFPARSGGAGARHTRGREAALGLVVAAGLLSAFGLGTAGAAGERGTLRIVTTGYETAEGHALLALCASAEDFDSRDRALRFGKVKPADGRAIFLFEDLPAGDYAIKVFQDSDGDQELDIGMFGPEEAYGFSNGARGTFGPPSWQEARFRFAGGDETVEINVD